MDPKDLFFFAGVPIVAVLLIWDAIKLSRTENWFDRVTLSYATVYSRLCEYGFWTIRHLIACIRAKGRRRELLKKAILSIGTFGLVFAPILVAAQVANMSPVTSHPVAFALGTAVWAMVVESPSLPYRIQHYAPQPELIHPIASALIVVALDLIVGGIVVASLLTGSTQAFAIGAAFVAAGDLVSGLVGLTTAAADHHPLADPAPKLSGSDTQSPAQLPGRRERMRAVPSRLKPHWLRCSRRNQDTLRTGERTSLKSRLARRPRRPR